jgi:hypothetical protein
MKPQTAVDRIKFSDVREAHHTKFSDVPVGQRFYDLISTEYFGKQIATMAAMVTGQEDGTVADEFELDDVVGIKQSKPL